MSNRDLIEAKLADFQRRAARRDMPGANAELVAIIHLLLDMIENRAPATSEALETSLGLPVYATIDEARNSPPGIGEFALGPIFGAGQADAAEAGDGRAILSSDEDAVTELAARGIDAAAEVNAAFEAAAPEDAPGDVLTGQQMAVALRDAGLPVSALAEAMGVERNTVYAWLDGVEPRGANASRLAAIHEALFGGGVASLREAYRYWSTPLAGGASMRDLLAAPTIDTAAVRDAVSVLLSRAEESSARRARLAISGGVNGFTEGSLEIGESA